MSHPTTNHQTLTPSPGLFGGVQYVLPTPAQMTLILYIDGDVTTLLSVRPVCTQ
ncbi:hypothetical protein DPMN_178368 [Dreissena polymorpha]|uniref:Uncharacterized protein n=1 Tax=Dreissena polymorpha TaxID=45954 RepID=A0A9D4EAG4_DREPO|nr:hypothetical protein DPMN_178368 [Dreissena polymorpha]